MTTITILIVLVAGILGIMKWKSVMRRHAAAVNVLLAKHTYATLSERDQQRVHDQAVNILNSVRHGGYREFDNETEKYGWYALAMAELHIAPSVRAYCYPTWNFVRNPYIAIFPRDKMLTMVSNYLRIKHGVEVTISLEDRGVEWLKSSRK